MPCGRFSATLCVVHSTAADIPATGNSDMYTCIYGLVYVNSYMTCTRSDTSMMYVELSGARDMALSTRVMVCWSTNGFSPDCIEKTVHEWTDREYVMESLRANYQTSKG